MSGRKLIGRDQFRTNWKCTSSMNHVPVQVRVERRVRVLRVVYTARNIVGASKDASFVSLGAVAEKDSATTWSVHVLQKIASAIPTYAKDVGSIVGMALLKHHQRDLLGSICATT